VIQAGNTLYGTASAGGTNGDGTLFSVSAAGANFTVLRDFAYTSDGESPRPTLIVSGNTLYGTAPLGGSFGYGPAYRVRTDGTGFTNLHNFSSPTDGRYPYGGVVQSGNLLYGLAESGGTGSKGAVYELILPPVPTPVSLNVTPSGGMLTLSWPSTAGGYGLQQSAVLSPASWSTYAGTLTTNGATISGTITPAAARAFFRLVNTNGQ